MDTGVAAGSLVDERRRGEGTVRIDVAGDDAARDRLESYFVTTGAVRRDQETAFSTVGQGQ